MSITNVTGDIVTRIKTVPELGSRVGLAVGGQEADPLNRELPRPSAWVVYVGDTLLSTPTPNPCNNTYKANFVVKILVDYDTESDLINTHFPLLHSVVTAVQGGEPSPGSRWIYEGQGLESLEPDRLVWAQSYSCNIVI